ncbi:MAG: peptidylprolyl isomerase [Spirochaetia bacterium]|nr:peptidylprolyl isomerase [Spirochaetia bacterium]
MKKVLLALSLLVLGIVFIGADCDKNQADNAAPAVMAAAADATVDPAKPVTQQIAVIETDKGNIKFRFFMQDAPKTCDNFIALASKGFYNGLTFHRYEPGFVIQGGDPSGNGTGGPGYSIKAEFNAKPHIAGTVAMARAADPDSAGSQFYICLAPAPFLDRNYTVFGQVTEGMETVLKLRAGDRMNKVYIETK